MDCAQNSRSRLPGQSAARLEAETGSVPAGGDFGLSKHLDPHPTSGNQRVKIVVALYHPKA